MVSLILVSHSHEIVNGVKSLIHEMTGDNNDKVNVLAVGGTHDGRLGTDPTKILEAIEQEHASDYIYLLGDIGSGELSIDFALDLIDDEYLKEKCHHFNAPLVEGGFSIGVQCLVDSSPEAIINELKNCINNMQVIDN